jgi:hypothetical protein
MNSEWTYDQAIRFAKRMASSKDLVGDAWNLALGRAPDANERAKAEQYLTSNGPERLCLLIFNMSEFLYVN